MVPLQSGAMLWTDPYPASQQAKTVRNALSYSRGYHKSVSPESLRLHGDSTTNFCDPYQCNIQRVELRDSVLGIHISGLDKVSGEHRGTTLATSGPSSRLLRWTSFESAQKSLISNKQRGFLQRSR